MRKLTILLLFIVPIETTAQNDTSILKEAYSNAVSVSNNKMTLFNGKQHHGYPSVYIGNPYFRTNEWLPGSVVYSDVLYDDLLVKYDLISNELIVKHPNGYAAVSLFTPRVQRFTIGNYRFIQVFNKEPDFIPPGVYEEMQLGKMSLYARRSKIIDENVTAAGIERKLVDKTTYYVVLNGVSYPIKKQKSIMELLGDKKNDIKTHLKELGIKYRGSEELVLTEIVKFYNK